MLGRCNTLQVSKIAIKFCRAFARARSGRATDQPLLAGAPKAGMADLACMLRRTTAVVDGPPRMETGGDLGVGLARSHIDRLRACADKYAWLVEPSVVEFFTSRLWERLPCDWRDALLQEQRAYSEQPHADLVRLASLGDCLVCACVWVLPACLPPPYMHTLCRHIGPARWHILCTSCVGWSCLWS